MKAMLVEFFVAYEGEKGHMYAWFKTKSSELNPIANQTVYVAGQEFVVERTVWNVCDPDRNGMNWLQVDLRDIQDDEFSDFEKLVECFAETGWTLDNLPKRLVEKFKDSLHKDYSWGQGPRIIVKPVQKTCCACSCPLANDEVVK
jgi:hypothetical protein